MDDYMDENISILKTKEITHGLIELRSDNILTFRPDIVTFKDYNLQVFKDLLEAFIDITDGIPRPYMCDNTYITGIVNKEALTYMSKHFDSFATKACMITNSPVTRLIVNDYNSSFNPKFEFKIFAHEEVAIKWLRQN